jgi:hypothetical protein
VGWVALRAYLQTEEGRVRWDQWKLELPLLGSLIREIEVSRFARTFGTLLQSGVPVLAAVSIVKETISNRVIAGAMSRLQEGAARRGVSGPAPALPPFHPWPRWGRRLESLERLIRVATTSGARTVKQLTSLLELSDLTLERLSEHRPLDAAGHIQHQRLPL